MKVLRVSFVGTRTQHFEATQALFRDVLGMEAAFSNPDWAGFTLPSGQRDLVEIFGPGMTDERVSPAAFDNGVLIAFAVDDIVSARAELAAAHVELVGDVVWAHDLTGGDESNRWGWFFFRAPDGNIYVIQQDGLPAAK
jgi:catechol 2,3-dioxygenase-like lactoylglutathione lyase family enzyme